ncbi:conserved hypothetical protein [Pediculus humanus corporis]|uniref:SSD domain-containing protein n=1 Tax=Pediculus humanus subsp. corporis TaxID=121224 RepID=E0VWS4_PEDHC|nr:uncharacterized protein Phum_PHUM490680 [Pediculus humanus corporis]EEB17830.1 conserved hypothetical protein [Pediculus humanus corporis]
MNWYFKFVANHPFVVVSTIGTLSVAALIISLISSKQPDFSDPQLGFETRGTIIAKRIISWENLYEAARPSGILTVNPNAVNSVFKSTNTSSNNSSTSKELLSNFLWHTQLNNSSSEEENYGKVKKLNDKVENYNDDEESFEIEKNFEEDFSNLESAHNHSHDHLSSDGFFCDVINPDYSHLVVETVNSSQSLLSLDALKSICIIQENLMNNEIMDSICQTVSHGHCCNPWSLPNYIALLYNHTSCFNITEKSVGKTKALLYECSKYYNNLQLSSDCHDKTLCRGVPKKCKKFNAVYNILYYLTDVDFLPSNYSKIKKENVFLNYTMIFLPIARSSAILPYYYNLSSSILKHDSVFVSAMDLGLKNTLFNDCLVRDAFLTVAGGGFMILCIWTYTNSIVITISTLLAVFMSLITSYFIYTFIFNIKFFPFMNLLAIIVAIGIGADDAFIFHKIWNCLKMDKGNPCLVKLVSDTLKHSSLSMFVTSLTTAAAFYSSSVSSITAINCFSVFAGTAVLVNFLLTVTWLPACFVISQKNLFPSVLCQCQPNFFNQFQTANKYLYQVKATIEKSLITLIFRLRWLWLIIFSAIAIGSSVIVLYHPKLRLPDSKNFHLFQSSHLFEKYDFVYKDKFWFERLERVTGWDNSNFKLPLRFVWGIHPVDNGNYFEPNSKGTLEFDPTFDMADPESQAWLLDFCRHLRTQPFYQSTHGPLLPNCFIESFKNWMQRRCKDSIDNIDRTPCCESSLFPFERETFKKCIKEAIGSLYETPSDYFLPGVAGPKFSKTSSGEIKVVVVEYDSNYSNSLSFTDMHAFYTEVEDWFQKQLEGAPRGMKNGWFISHLGFYDLQLALSNGTSVAIGVSMMIALTVFFFVSLNLLISIYTVITISCIIFVTVGFLVLIGWRLNVLESIAVTTAIGLAVDFSLHYGIHYGLSIDNDRKSAVEFTLNKMIGPTFMAALTTGAAGFFMLPSSVLAYIQIGVFLLILMTSSWFYSTIFLMSLLSVFGPLKGFGQFSYKHIFRLCSEKDINSPAQSNKTLYTNIFSDVLPSSSATDEIVSRSPRNSREIHEVKTLTGLNRKKWRLKNGKKSCLKHQSSEENAFSITTPLSDKNG